MKETLTLRLKPEASRFLRPGEGSGLLGLISVDLAASDPRLQHMAEAEEEAWATSGVGLTLGWDIHRNYTKHEIAQARLFRLITKGGFLPTGEECGTDYDFSGLCPHCGAGRVQRSALILDIRKLPKRAGIVHTLGGEIVVSQQIAGLMVDEKLTGFSLQPVRHKTSHFTGPLKLESVPSGRALIAEAEKLGVRSHEWEFYVWLNGSEANTALWEKALCEAGIRLERRSLGKPLPVWYQLVPEGTALNVSHLTRFGINPINRDVAGQFRCPLGHTAGFATLSEVSISKSDWDGRDFCVTSKLTGHHPVNSLIYPRPLLIASARFRSFLVKYEVRAFRSEVAHLVGSE